LKNTRSFYMDKYFKKEIDRENIKEVMKVNEKEAIN
jgi:hypothetical protein